MDRYMVIDANVARSCADPARHETSEACLRLTNTLQGRNCKVGVALTPALCAEWRKHASPAFAKWWANMESRRRIRMEDDRRVGDYRGHLGAIEDEGVRTAMEKDAHLVEISLVQHYPIASQDDKQRRYVAELASVYPLVGKVQWFNPVSMNGWEEWLATGCADVHVYRCEGSAER